MWNQTVANVTDAYNSSPTQQPARDFGPIHIILPTVMSFICLFGLTANILVVYVLLAHVKLKTIPSVFILNLAISDIIYMLCLPFVAYQYATSDWVFGLVTCKVVSSIDLVNQLTGIYLLTLMSFDRYLGIVRWSLSARLRTLTHAKVACLLVWIGAVAISPPTWIYSTLYPSGIGGGAKLCAVIFPNPAKHDLIYLVCVLCVGFALPLVVISYCYFWILDEILAKRMSRQRGDDDSFGVTGKQQKPWKITVLVSTCVVVFVFSWLPYYVALLLLVVGSPAQPTRGLMVFFYVSLCLTYLNSCLNPFIYSLAGENFRQGFGKVLSRSSTRSKYTINSVTVTPKTIRRHSLNGFDNAAVMMDGRTGSFPSPGNAAQLTGHQLVAMKTFTKDEEAGTLK